MRKNRGSLFIISAPSGAGKTTLCRKLGAYFPNLKHSVSYTTRKPRQGEVNDVDYTFVSRDEFRLMTDREEFVEWAKVHGNFYGTSRKRLDGMLDRGIDVILDIDTQGAMQIRQKYDRGIFIFVLPPSMEILKERLTNRMSNSGDEIEKRLERAYQEIKDYKNYDYVIINDRFDEAIDELQTIIRSAGFLTNNIDPVWVEEHYLR